MQRVENLGSKMVDWSDMKMVELLAYQKGWLMVLTKGWKKENLLGSYWADQMVVVSVK